MLAISPGSRSTAAGIGDPFAIHREQARFYNLIFAGQWVTHYSIGSGTLHTLSAAAVCASNSKTFFEAFSTWRNAAAQAPGSSRN